MAQAKPIPGLVSRMLGAALAVMLPGAVRAAGMRQRTDNRSRFRYDAARMDRVRGTPRSGSADGDLLPDLRVLREKSRTLIRDDAHAAAAVRVLVENVVGSGIRPQAAARPESTGLSQAQCDAWNATAEQIWHEWAEQQADANELCSFDELTRLIYRARLVDGEAIAHRVVVADRNRTIRTAWELIDADRLQDPYTAEQSTRLGVEIGERGQPTAYWITPYHPDDVRFLTGRLIGTNVPERIPRSAMGLHNVLHVFRRERTGQNRGIPALTSAMPLFEHLHHYLDSELIAARANSNIAMFVKRPLDPRDPDISPIENDAGRDGETIYHEQLESGTIEYLNEGEEIAPFIPNRPGTTFDPFVVRILRAICSSLGLPYELVVKDVGGMNYSSARVALLEARRGFEVEQSHLITTWLRPAWETVIRDAVLSGALPTFPSMVQNMRPFFAARWIRAAWGWVDPVKEIDAARQACEANLSTPDIEASRAGLDVTEILEARARFFVQAREIEQRNKLEPGTLTRERSERIEAVQPAGQAKKPGAAPGEKPAEDDAGDDSEDGDKPKPKEDQ